MPNGFPAFRHDPTTAPRYIIKTAKTTSDAASTSTDSTTQQSAEAATFQHPTEQAPSKKSQPKLKGKLEKLFG